MEPLSPGDPERIDEFVLEGRLGTGGYGVVYAAADSKGRRVALKVLRSELADNANLRERLKREGEALSRVGGDRNVEIYKVQTEGSHTYLAMELVEVKPSSNELTVMGHWLGRSCGSQPKALLKP